MLTVGAATTVPTAERVPRTDRFPATYHLSESTMRYIPRTEHPRPDFQRERWLNLNGVWQFEFDPDCVGVEQGWHSGRRDFTREIAVPFPWESSLSGIQAPDYQGAAWYQRTFQVPDEWRKHRVLLKFGAVDWEARVWVNGVFVGVHRGGYVPFEFDITDHLVPGDNTLVVRAFDDTHPDYPSGKQTGWYTRTSGIWQTVYLEAIGDARLTQLHVTPDVANEVAYIDARIIGAADEYSLELTFLERGLPEVRRVVMHNGASTHVRVTVPIPDPELWSPEHPALYELTATLLRDEVIVDSVQTYFGMRTISRGRYGDRPYEYILLNGEPIYLIGALHQSFHPDGIYTYPSDSVIRGDIERAKNEYGFNFLRIHIKVDEPRLYYWADRLGLLIMYDLPNTTHDNDKSRAYWEQTFREAVARDYNHPSIFSWVLFNETWGIGHGEYTDETQQWVADMYGLAKSLDTTRLVEDNSPCRYDHVVTDINSWHFYIDDYAKARQHIGHVVAETHDGSGFNYIGGRTQGIQPLINSEFGNVSAGGGDRDISWGVKYLTNELRRHDKICGYIYTELTDLEWEHNGVMNYDRSRKEFGYSSHVPGFSIRQINAPDFLVIDCEPCPSADAGETLSIPVAISHWSRRDEENIELHWVLTGVDVRGRTKVYSQDRRPASWVPYTVHPLGDISVTLPNERCLATLAVWLRGRRGILLASNYINIDVQADVPMAEKIHAGTVLARFRPEDYARCEWSGRTFPEAQGKAAGCGTGLIEYHVALPEGIAARQLDTVEIVFEGAAKADAEKLDWPARRRDQDYPQTDTRKHPTDLRLTLNEGPSTELAFADDPADMRGVLSHLASYHHGSYGDLTRITFALSDTYREQIEADGQIRLRFEVSDGAANQGGFCLFGARTGRYPFDPHIILRYRDDTLPAEWRTDEPLTRDVHQ